MLGERPGLTRLFVAGVCDPGPLQRGQGEPASQRPATENRDGLGQPIRSPRARESRNLMASRRPRGSPMFLPAAVAAFTLAQPPAATPFEFKDGDRVVWIGNTLVEREQRYGYWEAAVLAANAGKKITVRNL